MCRSGGRGKPLPDHPSDPVPLTLLKCMTPVPGRVLFHKCPPLGIIRVIPHHLVSHGVDLRTRDKTRQDRALDYGPTDTNHDGRHRRGDRQPFQRKQEPIQAVYP